VAASRSLGRAEVLISSVPFAGTSLGTVVATKGEAFATATPKLDGVPHGTGDLLSALYLAARLDGKAPRGALENAASATNAVIAASIGQDELALIPAQHLLTDPTPRLVAQPITP